MDGEPDGLADFVPHATDQDCSGVSRALRCRSLADLANTGHEAGDIVLRVPLRPRALRKLSVGRHGFDPHDPELATRESVHMIAFLNSFPHICLHGSHGLDV